MRIGHSLYPMTMQASNLDFFFSFYNFFNTSLRICCCLQQPGPGKTSMPSCTVRPYFISKPIMFINQLLTNKI